MLPIKKSCPQLSNLKDTLNLDWHEELDTFLEAPDINYKTQDGVNFLMFYLYSAEMPSVNTVQLMVQEGIDTSCRDVYRQNALIFAAQNSSVSVDLIETLI